MIPLSVFLEIYLAKSACGKIVKFDKIYTRFVEGLVFHVYSFLDTYNVEKWKKFLELKFFEPGVCVFSNKLKMACARNLKA